MALPSRAEWEVAVSLGWPGPDGSSCSTDTIFGVRIGITSAEYEHAFMPANSHDWRYLLGRTFRLGEEYRRAADQDYRDLCYELCQWELSRALWPAAWLRCETRWAALRGFGWASFTRKQKEAHERALLAWYREPCFAVA